MKDKISINNFNQLLEKVRILGFDDVLYSFIPKPLYSHPKLQPKLHFSDGLTDFVNYYIKNDFGNRDFVLRLASEGVKEPIDWWEQINLGNVSHEEQQVTIAARDLYGINHGLSISVPHGKFAICGISVISKKEDRGGFIKLKESTIEDLLELAESYHRLIISKTKELDFFVTPIIDSLSNKKLMVLQHLLSGAPITEIENHYPISRRYAEKLLIQIKTELGCKSTYELMYILGTINIDSFFIIS